MLREKSCGIVPFREVDGEILYLVISSAVTKREHWEFPKGGVEPGERELDTALRELWEETGVKDVEVLRGFREPIRYIYRRPEGLVSKQVVYFIGRVGDPRVTLREVEAKDHRWAKYEESRKLLRHSNARALLDRCHAFITGKPLPPRQQAAERGDAAEAERRRGRRGRRSRSTRRDRAIQARSGGRSPAQPEPSAAEARAGLDARTEPKAEARVEDAQGRAAAEGARRRRRRRRRRGGRRHRPQQATPVRPAEDPV